MSGRKYTTVSIRQDELSKLREQARELSRVRQDLPQLLESSIRVAEQNAEARIRPIQQRQQEYQRALEKASETIRRIETESARKIAAQAARAEAENEATRKELQGQLDAVRQAQIKRDEQIESRIKRLDKQIEEQAKDLNGKINKEQQARRKADAEIQHQIDGIKADRERSRIFAEECIRDCTIIGDFIRGHYQHERFLPGELARIEQQISSATRILNQNVPDSALAIAVVSVNDLSALRIRLEEMEAEWTHWKTQVTNIAKALLDAIKVSKSVPQIEDKGSEISQADYWARGRLGELEEKIRRILEEVERENSDLTIPEMKRLAEQLPGEQDSLEAINEAVQESILRSQNRVSIADTAMASLIEGNGFAPDGATYVGEDLRESVVAHVKNLSGDKVVITITSEGDDERVTVDTIEELPRSEQERRLQMEGIAGSLREAGYQVEQPVTASQLPSKENSDLEEVRKRKTTPTPAQPVRPAREMNQRI